MYNITLLVISNMYRYVLNMEFRCFARLLDSMRGAMYNDNYIFVYVYIHSSLTQVQYEGDFFFSYFKWNGTKRKKSV